MSDGFDGIDGTMWVAGRAEFQKYAERYRIAQRHEEAATIADIAPAEIFGAMRKAELLLGIDALTAPPVPPDISADELLRERDAFIVRKGLWQEFVASLPTARAALSSPALPGVERVEREAVPADVAELVIAARVVAFEDQSPDALKRLDKASEAFANRVPWEDEPSHREWPSFEELTARAVSSVRELDDWANVNETNYTGWGEGDVPPMATFWRVKTGQALKALNELPAAKAQQ